MPRLIRIVLRALVGVLLIVGLAACQVRVDVATTMAADGSGQVSVGVGLDDEALAKAGDLGSQLRVDDLRAAGWTVTGPSREPDGMTWVRASKPFADPAAATGVIDEINGADGAFRGWKLSRSSSTVSSDYAATGTIDLTKGMATFGDDALTKAMGGDTFGDAVRQLEQEQGRPVSDMVDVRVQVRVPGEVRTYRPTLADQKVTKVSVKSSRASDLVWWLMIGGLVVALLVGLVALRRRQVVAARARRRTPRSRHLPVGEGRAR